MLGPEALDRLAFRQAIQFLKKCGEGNSGTVRVANYGVSIRSQARNGERHSDAVISARLNLCPVQLSCVASLHLQPVGAFFHRRAHPARSEEHTSELQSQSNLVCRLLLEK